MAVRLCGDALLNERHVAVHEVDDPRMITGVFVADPTALHDGELGERHFNRLDALAVDGRREDQRIVLAVVPVRVHAVVHGLTLGKELPDALQDMDADLPVVEGEPEETGLCLLIFQRAGDSV